MEKFPKALFLFMLDSSPKSEYSERYFSVNSGESLVGFVNLIFCRGPLVSVAQLRYRPDGSPVCEFTLVFDAENSSSGDSFLLDVTVLGTKNQIFQLQSQLKAGTVVFLEGQLKTQKIQPYRGVFSPYRVLAKSVIILGTKEDVDSLAVF